MLEYALHSPEAGAGEDDDGGSRLSWRRVDRGRGKRVRAFG
jgi:hypothetical protein